MAAPRKTRAESALARREAIVAAATAEFVDKGFAAARIEDIAARAHVAKGTVYLSFADKQALFESVVRERIAPIVQAIAAGLDVERPTVRETLEAVLRGAAARLSDPDAGAMIRLVVGESIRFPDLTAFYRREVIFPVAQRCARLLDRAAQSGELTAPAAARFPQLAIAPLMLSVVFGRALAEVGVSDFDALLQAHLDTLFSGPATRRD